MEKDEYNIILSPLIMGGYGPKVKTADGKTKVYGIIGPIRSNMSGDIEFSTEYVRDIVLHEFSHSFVNPITTKNIDEVNKYKSLYKPISEIMKKQAYADWETCVNEHIVRAVTTRIAYIYEGEAAGEKALKYEKSNGFIYIDNLCEKLKYFEENKNNYASFEEFYPELIEVFKNL